MKRIPLVDLSRQHRWIATELNTSLGQLFENADYILGDAVGIFERRFAAFGGIEHCVSVATGTDAIELSLRAYGIGPGDEVILPTNTFIATALACARIGAIPVLADVDDVFGLLDPEDVKHRMTQSTKAIIAVHLYGQMAPMHGLRELTTGTGVVLLEDAAQAHGATQDSCGPGTMSGAATYSFYPSKNLGAYGDGGAVVTTSADLAARLRALRNYGGESRNEHWELGFNSRLDTLQAHVLLAKLRHLAEWNQQRSRAAKAYDELLADVPGARRPEVALGNDHVWHLYVVRVPDRDTVLRGLIDRGVGGGIHYPSPIHMIPAFSFLKHTLGDFPVSERLAAEILSLPLFPGITIEEQRYVVASLREAMRI